MNGPTTLYRLYDQADMLLYVGISGRWPRRFDQHAADKPWWAEVVSIRLERYPSREAALIAEAMTIRAEHPRHNGTKPAPPQGEPERHVCAAGCGEPLMSGATSNADGRGWHLRCAPYEITANNSEFFAYGSAAGID